MYSIGGLGVITSIIYTHSFSAKLEVWSTHHRNWVVTGWWLGVLALVATFWNYWKYNYDWIIWNAAWQWLAESGKKSPVLPGQPVISCFADDQPRLFSCNKKVWRSWVQAVHNLVAYWAGFDYWSWGQFSNMTNMGINKLLGPDLEKFTV